MDTCKILYLLLKVKSYCLTQMDDVITNTIIFQNPELGNVRNVLKDYIKNLHYRFIQFNIMCK